MRFPWWRAAAMRETLRTRDGDRCRHCGRSFVFLDSFDETIDHVVPWRWWRLRHPDRDYHCPDNLQLLCRRCNAAKGSALVSPFPPARMRCLFALPPAPPR